MSEGRVRCERIQAQFLSGGPVEDELERGFLLEWQILWREAV
jgi:hypothetical protein